MPPPASATATPEVEPREPEPAPPAATASTETPATPPPEDRPASDTPSGSDETLIALENGLYWSSREDDTRALGWFQQCVRHDSSQARCHLELARIHARRGARQEALKHFTHHLALESDGPSAEEARRYLKLYAGMDPP